MIWKHSNSYPFFIFRTLLFWGLAICFSRLTKASHIIGGEMTYRWLAGNTYEIKLQLYQECASQVDDTVSIGIFNNDNDALYDSVYAIHPTVSSLQYYGPTAPCFSLPVICGNIVEYITTITLPSRTGGYYIVWESCCRGQAQNFNSNGFYGMVFYCQMPDPALHNSSPVFNVTDFPVTLNCNGLFRFDMSASDIDADSLVYILTDPLAGNTGEPVNPVPFPTLPVPLPLPYYTINYNPGYSLSNLTGNQFLPLSIERDSGFINAYTEMQGVYAIAIDVIEYRNGVQIGKVRKEIQYTALACTNPPPYFYTEANNYAAGSTITVYEEDSVCFNLIAIDNTDSVYIDFDVSMFTGALTTPIYTSAMGAGTTVASFCWKTICGQGGVTYPLIFRIKDNGCPMSTFIVDTFYINVIDVPIGDKLVPVCFNSTGNALICRWEPYSFNPAFFKQYNINRITNDTIVDVLPPVTDIKQSLITDMFAIDTNFVYCYTISSENICGEQSTVSDSICSNDILPPPKVSVTSVSVTGKNQIEINWQSVNGASYATTTLLKGYNQQPLFFNQPIPIPTPLDSSYSDAGVNTMQLSYCYKINYLDACLASSDSGYAGCSILLTGNANAVNHLQWNPYYHWQNGVKAYEIYRRTEVTPYQLIATVDSLTLSFDDITQIPEGGIITYYVLAIENSAALNTSKSNELELTPDPLVFIPNAFTPNNDMLNDTWQIKTHFIRSLQLSIYNRWGNLIYKTYNTSINWNGTLNGKKLPEGIYYYRLFYEGYNAPYQFYKEGYVALIK